MLIYNHNFEFIGINEKDLNQLGFKTFSELQSRCDDFADLFVKKPGYIHNFKNLKWILYILNSNAQEAKAIIEANGTTFAANLMVETLYMKDTPDKASYIVTLQNLHQTNNAAHSLDSHINDSVIFDTTAKEEPPIEPDTTIQSAPPKLSIETTEPASGPEDKTPNTKKSPMLGDYLTPSQPTANKKDGGYLYDPRVAADELGLPIDLIEEFIGDFIQQSYDFKDKLYAALDNEDHEALKSLSHKLKGVAANLRIEDAFEALSIVNTSSDSMEIKQNLDLFYDIIHTLDKQEEPFKAQQQQSVIDKEMNAQTSIVDDDLYTNLLQDEDLLPVNKEEPAAQILTDAVKETEKSDNLSPTIKADAVLNYDRQKTANELGLDESTVDSLLSEYKVQLIALVQNMSDAASSVDVIQIHKLALNSKGTSDNLRLQQISTLLEQLIFSDNLQEIDDIIVTLKQYATQI